MDSRKYPDKCQVVLPKGTLDRLRSAARREGTSQAEMMRQAILRALREPAAAREPAQEAAE